MLPSATSPTRSLIERWHRRSARIALYGSLLLSGAFAAVAVHLANNVFLRGTVDLEESQAWYEVDWESMPEVQLFQGYLQVDTNVIDGNEQEGAEYLARQFEAAGIPYHLERLGERRANLWAVLEGEDPRAIVLQHHIDVEPILRPDAWRLPPFSGTVEAPWIYGRGAFDMKSIAIAQLWAMLELKRSGTPLTRSVIYLATSSEERGSDFGSRWVLRNHPELVERFGLVLTEGGVVEAVNTEQAKFWGTEIGQKRFVDLQVCSSDRERLEELRTLINTTPHEVTNLRLTDEVAAMWPIYATTRNATWLRELLADPEALLTDINAFEKLPVYLQAMLRDEKIAFPVEELDGYYQMTVKVHLLPGADFETTRRRVVPDWMLYGFDVVIEDNHAAAHGSPADHPVLGLIADLVTERHPGVTPGPFFLPWTATDSRFYRAHDIPSYGFSPFFILTPDTLTGSKPNERVALPGFVDGAHIYADLLVRLMNPELQLW